MVENKILELHHNENSRYIHGKGGIIRMKKKEQEVIGLEIRCVCAAVIKR